VSEWKVKTKLELELLNALIEVVNGVEKMKKIPVLLKCVEFPEEINLIEKATGKTWSEINE
jgi:hypothetical protein